MMYSLLLFGSGLLAVGLIKILLMLIFPVRHQADLIDILGWNEYWEWMQRD